MNSRVKLLLSSVVFTLIGTQATFAADDGTIAVAPTPSEITESSKKTDGKRGQTAALDQRVQQLDQRLQLQLTPEQKEKIRDIFAKETAAARGSAGKKDRQPLMSDQKVMDEIRAVLTPEQRAKLDGQKPGRRGGGPGGAKKAK